MKSWQERVLQEKKELDNKLRAINTALNNSLFSMSWEDSRLLNDQRDVMRRYSDILAARIYNFKEND